MAMIRVTAKATLGKDFMRSAPNLIATDWGGGVEGPEGPNETYTED